jgi:hypothetical protein
MENVTPQETSAEFPNNIHDIDKKLSRGRPFFTLAQKKFRDVLWSEVVVPMEKEKAKLELEKRKGRLHDEVILIHEQSELGFIDKGAATEVIRNIRDVLTVLKSAVYAIEIRGQKRPRQSQSPKRVMATVPDVSLLMKQLQDMAQKIEQLTPKSAAPVAQVPPTPAP